MNIETLQRFVILAGCLNYTFAAKTLHITQPGLSKSIAELEREVGTPLLNREPEISLTPAGLFVRERAELILHEYAAIMNDAKSIAKEEGAGLTVCVPYATDAAYRAVSAALRQFRSNRPYAGIKTNRSTVATMFRQLATNKLDLGTIILFEEGRTEIEVEGEGVFALAPLCHDTPMLLVPVDHPLAAKDVITMDDIESLPLMQVSTPPFDTFALTLESFCQVAGIAPAFVTRGAATLEEFVAACESANLGVLLGSQGILDPAATPELTPRMVMKSAFDPPLASCVYFAYRKGDSNPLLRDFIDRTRELVEHDREKGAGGRP